MCARANQSIKAHRLTLHPSLAFASLAQGYKEYLVSEGKDIYDDFNENLVAFLTSDVGKKYVRERSERLALPLFLALTPLCCFARRYYLDVKCDTESNFCSRVKVSRYTVWNKSTGKAEVFAMSREMGTKIKELGIDAFVYNMEFLHLMLDHVMYDYIVNNLGITLLLVFGVMFVFTDNVSCFFITAMVAMIDLDLMG